MSFLNLTFTAIRGLASNKLRAILTTLGIIIGVASVIVMLALGNGARAAVAAQFRFLGSDSVQISERKIMKNGEIASTGQILSYADGLNLPSQVPMISRVDMQVGGTAKVRHERSVENLNFGGVNASNLDSVAASGTLQPVNWPSGTKLTAQDFIGQGRFFTDAETLGGDMVCVLGYQTFLDLFGGDNPLGQTVWVNHHSYTVIGVIAELEYVDPAQRYSSDPNISLYLPISTAIQQQFSTEPSVNITAHVTDESKIDKIKYDISTYLEKRHNVQKDAQGKMEDDFDITTRNDVLGAQLDAARTFSLLLAAMATVSLVVGGIGIMNVMLVSVTERTREIGIRLAIGAQKGDIIQQFLFEAVLISALGGLFGIAVGVLTIPLAASLNNGVALLAPNSIPLAFGVALLVGILFGIYPAARAAQLDPMEALRYE
jgi:putative ABC transport system permease protein